MIESTMQLEISTGVGKLKQELHVGGAGSYKNRFLTGKLERLSFLTPIWLGTPNFKNIILEFWNTCSQRGQIVAKIALGAPVPHCSQVGSLNKKVLPSKLKYLLACDNIAKKLGGCIIITNCDKILLQIKTAKLLQIMSKFYSSYNS